MGWLSGVPWQFQPGKYRFLTFLADSVWHQPLATALISGAVVRHEAWLGVAALAVLLATWVHRRGALFRMGIQALNGANYWLSKHSTPALSFVATAGIVSPGTQERLAPAGDPYLLESEDDALRRVLLIRAMGGEFPLPQPYETYANPAGVSFVFLGGEVQTDVTKFLALHEVGHVSAANRAMLVELGSVFGVVVVNYAGLILMLCASKQWFAVSAAILSALLRLAHPIVGAHYQREILADAYALNRLVPEVGHERARSTVRVIERLWTGRLGVPESLDHESRVAMAQAAARLRTPSRVRMLRLHSLWNNLAQISEDGRRVANEAPIRNNILEIALLAAIVVLASIHPFGVARTHLLALAAFTGLELLRLGLARSVYLRRNTEVLSRLRGRVARAEQPRELTEEAHHATAT